MRTGSLISDLSATLDEWFPRCLLRGRPTQEQEVGWFDHFDMGRVASWVCSDATKPDPTRPTE